MSAHDVAAPVTFESQPTTNRKESEGTSGTRSPLRGMSYADGQTALTPPSADAGIVQRKADDNTPPETITSESTANTTESNANTTESNANTTESNANTTVATTSTTDSSTTGSESEQTPGTTTNTTTPEVANDKPAQTPGDGDGDPDKRKDQTEEQAVAETHAMTLDALEAKILQLSGSTKKIFNFRKKAKAADFAKEIFFYLSSYDSTTITAAFTNVKADCAAAFGDLIKAIGYKDAARKYPRESRATLAAHGDLKGFAESCADKNPYAAMMAVTMLPEADRTAFIAAHPGFDAKLTAVDRESLAADAFFGKEKALRQDEEAYRKRTTKDIDQEAKDTDAAKPDKQDEASQKFMGEVQATLTAGKNVEALILLGSHTNNAEVRAAVRQMDAGGQVTGLLQALSFDEKWNTYSLHTRRMLSVRSADVNIQDAHAMFPELERKTNRKGKVKAVRNRNSTLTSEEAYAVFQFTKALPAAHREQFQKAYPALWEEMNAHMNGSMKEADDTNYLGAHGGDQEAITGLLVQLDDPKFWFEAPPGKLSGTLKLILAAGHRADVGAKLHAMSQTSDLSRLFLDGGRRAAIEGVLGLTGDPNKLPAEGTPEQQAAAWLGCLKLEQKISAEDDKPQMKIFKALGALTHANRETRKEIKEEKEAWQDKKDNGEDPGPEPDRDKPTLLKQLFGKKGVKVENLALDELEDMNTSKKGQEDFFGLDFTEIDRSKEGDEGQKDDQKDRNRVDVEFNPYDGKLVFSAPSLELDSVRFPAGDMLIQTGPVLLKNLHLDVQWPTAGNPGQKQRVLAEASVVDARDIMITGPGVMASIGHLGVQKFNFLLQEQDVDYSDNPDASQILKIVSEQNPARSLIAALMSGRIDGATTELTEYLGGFPGGAQGGIQLDVGNVTVEGIQVGAGAYVDKASIDGIALTYDTRPSVHFEARQNQLGGMIDDARKQLATLPQGQLLENDAHKKTRLEGDITRWGEEQTKLGGEIPKWKEKEQLYQDIFELNRLLGADAQKSNTDERAKVMKARAAGLGFVVPESAGLGDILQIVHKDLAHHAGATVSVDNINVKGIDAGGAKVDEVNVANVDVSGEGDALASSLDMATVKRLGGSGSQNEAGDYVASEVSADVGNVEVKGISISGGAPMAALLIKTRDKYHALEKMAERKPLDDSQFQALDAQWKVVLADGRSYGEVAEQMASLYELHGADIQKDQQLLSEFKACESALSGHPITVEAISISGISIQSGTGAGQATTLDNKPVTSSNAHSKVKVGEVDVNNVSAGDMKVGNVTATGISAEANVDLLSNPQGIMKPDAGEATLKADAIRAKNIDAGGSNISEAGVEDVSLQVSSNSEGSSVALDIGKVYAKGVGVEQGNKTAEDKKAALLEQIKQAQAKGEPCADLESQLHAIEDGLAKYTQAYADQDVILAEVKTIEGQIEIQQKKLEAAKREAAVTKHKDPKAAAKTDAARIAGLQGEIDKLGIQRDAAKKRLSEPQAVIDGYETSLGLKGEVSLENIHVAVSGLPNLAEVMKVASGDPTADLSGVYGIQLGLGPLTIPSIDYASSQMRVALGGATMKSLSADAKITVEKVPAKDGKPASHQVKSLAIAKFAVPEVTGSNLNLVMGVAGEQVQIQLPTVSLKGLTLEDVNLPGLDAEAFKTATGEFKLAEVSASMSAKVGDSMKANGNLSMKGVHAEALSSGAVNFGLGDLTLDKLGFEQVDKNEKKGGGSIVTQIISIGGKATKLGKLSVEGSYDRNTSELATTVDLADLTLAGVNYSGGGAHLGVGYAALKGVKATVAVKFKQGDVPAGESNIESLYLNRLYVASLAGKKIDYNGKGQQRERFGDGTEKVTAVEQHIGLEAGTLYGIDVGRMRLDGDGDKGLALSLKSGKVTDLDIWMKQNGKQVLATKATASVEGVSVSLVDDDLKLGIKKFSGSADVKIGSGDQQTSISVGDVSVANTNVAVNDMGKESQSTTATVDQLTARQLDFAMGVKGSDMNSAHGLGGAQLNGITFKDDKAKTSVDIKSGSGALVANSKMVGATSGNYDSKDPNAQKKDEFVVPLYKVDYDITALDTLNGTTTLLYPDGATFLHLNIVNGVVKLDVTDNIKQMWSGWWQDIKGDGLASWGLDADAWGKRLTAIQNLDDNAFYTMMLKGVELAFNQWGESLTGGWSNIASSVVGLLNADPKTSLVKAEPLAFASFQDSLNEAMKTYVDAGISKVLDYGVLYDLGKGDYGRAAGDAGLWLVEWFGEAVGWDAADQWAEEKRDVYKAEREGELRKIVASFVGYITSGGVDMALGSTDGKLSAKKTPLAGGPTKPLLSSLLDVDVKGGGSLKGGISASALGVLREFHYQDGGTSIDMNQLTFSADAKATGNVDFDEKTSRFNQADLDIGAGTFIEFNGLHFETDKTFKEDALPSGVRKTSDQQAEHGNSTSGNGAVTDGSTVRYDAGQYSEMMQNGQDPVGPNYSTELGMGDNLKSKGMGILSEQWADAFKTKTIAAQNAEVFGGYAPKGKATK